MATRKRRDFLYDAITMEGGLFSPDLLAKICDGSALFQDKEAYGVRKGLQLNSEYSDAFTSAKAHWVEFTPTERFVRGFLHDVLGYSMERPEVPLIIAPHGIGLDEPYRLDASRPKKTAFQAMQETLNSDPAGPQWGLAANGKTIRLLRASSSLTRPAYLEVDIQRIMEEERYPDFRAMWFILHSTRAKPAPKDDGKPDAVSIWEAWRNQGLNEGSRVRDKLSEGVGAALLSLGSGFLSHPDNRALRKALSDGTLTARDFYRELLRLIYRMLFVITLEERNKLPAQTHGEAEKTYSNGYSFRRLRRRSLGAATEPSRYSDLWLAVQVVFRSLAQGEGRLALPALGGIFTPDQCPSLDKCSLSNRALLTAMRSLRWAEIDGVLSPVDYRNMGAEEIGSVYEILLEYEPVVHVTESAGEFALPGFGVGKDSKTPGNERKTTGSYYTPDSLVEKLIESALAPVIKRAEQSPDPEKALLSLSVLDPACGSGHFLIAAARRIASSLANHREFNDYSRALRDVVPSCIYGVDLNPLAVELATFTLWLEAYEPGRPLSFLEHHVKCGNSLIGLIDAGQLKDGIPKEAYAALSGDDKKVCKELRKENEDGIKRLADNMYPLLKPDDWHRAKEADISVERMKDDTLDGIERKKQAYQDAQKQKHDTRDGRAADVYTGAFLHADLYTGAFMEGKPGKEALRRVPTTRTLCDLLSGGGTDPDTKARVEAAQQTCTSGRVFHWYVEFPQIIEHGGFDCILANPPWERIKLQEKEFFAAREPLIAYAKNKAERERRIALLKEGRLRAELDGLPYSGPDQNEQRLYAEFIMAKRLAEASSVFSHITTEGSRFRLTGVGDVNTYALFAETIDRLLSPNGRAGFITPTGIATDNSTRAFFQHITQNHRLASLYDFENREGLFQDIDSRMRFCLMTLDGGRVEKAQFAFFLTNVGQISDPKRVFTLGAEDFALMNPNTLTSPIFRSSADADLTREIYTRVPVFVRPNDNPWEITFMRMFDMS
ncbi:MAG: N-6 DNA methylase, partial [Synergistaceae bacterium]|nr:N-6 DNA methylase [Synergistaceae bacterium]